MIGLIGEAGDPRFPDFVDFLQSALRVEDGVFRMTRDRVVLHLADVERFRAVEILERLLARFHDEFPQMTEASFQSYYVEVRPGEGEPTIKDVLPTLFGAEPVH
jgi:GGDEF domain-containing protein